jgi:hypothetical protein
VICGRQSGTGAGSLRVLPYPLPRIPPIAQHLSSVIIIIQDWYDAPVVAFLIVVSVELYSKNWEKYHDMETSPFPLQVNSYFRLELIPLVIVTKILAIFLRYSRT